MAIDVTRLPLKLRPNPRRVITRFFGPGDEKRMRGIIDRILAIPEAEVGSLAAALARSFNRRHADLDAVFEEHYERVRHCLPHDISPSEPRRLLIGACFTMEYALESAALFNPSIVPAIDQNGVPPGSTRFLMSLRSTGEGHISSVVFRRGIIDPEGGVRVDPVGASSRPLRAVVPTEFDKAAFIRDLNTFYAVDGTVKYILDRLGDHFTLGELSAAIDAARQDHSTSGQFEECADTLVTLTRVNYKLEFPRGMDEAEVVIFPFSDIERNGIEDLRMVRFTEDDGSHCYFGTYSAYDGARVYPQLLEYPLDPYLHVSLITGRSARNKGMALFPRRVRGRYAMISRLDNENLYYMESDDVRFWDDAKLLETPRFPWEIIQIGNCGSPIETEFGWLLLTHGVGPMRRYCIGATLLDRDDPTRVIGRTSEPLLMPAGSEWAGYVPNVVYSCGAMTHGNMLILPYAVSDRVTSFARVNLDELLASLRGV
jgi:predicted GH43/DUF377 family glycosyl hydrolase